MIKETSGMPRCFPEIRAVARQIEPQTLVDYALFLGWRHAAKQPQKSPLRVFNHPQHPTQQLIIVQQRSDLGEDAYTRHICDQIDLIATACGFTPIQLLLALYDFQNNNET